MGSENMQAENRQRLNHLIGLAKRQQITSYEEFVQELKQQPNLAKELDQVKNNVVVGFSLYLYFKYFQSEVEQV